MRRAARRRLVVALAVLLVLAGCAAGGPAAVRLPPAGGRLSYQIGGAYPPAAGTQIVARDRRAEPDPDAYSVCYVNAFQAQPGEVAWWTEHHPDLLLRRTDGSLVVDADWAEPLLDLSTPARRDALVAVVGGWVDGCARSGFDAVEADNLDSYTRSEGLLTEADALTLARALAVRAHGQGLAIGQKNAADLTGPGRRAGFDFAVAEECQVYAECDAYTAAYGRSVLEIEYTDQPRRSFVAACRARGDRISVTRRDRDVTPRGDPAHVEEWC